MSNIFYNNIKKYNNFTLEELNKEVTILYFKLIESLEIFSKQHFVEYVLIEKKQNSRILTFKDFNYPEEKIINFLTTNELKQYNEFLNDIIYLEKNISYINEIQPQIQNPDIDFAFGIIKGNISLNENQSFYNNNSYYNYISFKSKRVLIKTLKESKNINQFEI